MGLAHARSAKKHRLGAKTRSFHFFIGTTSYSRSHISRATSYSNSSVHVYVYS